MITRKYRWLLILLTSGAFPLIIIPDLFLFQNANAEVVVVSADTSGQQTNELMGHRPVASDSASHGIWWASFAKIVGSAVAAAALGWIAWIRVSQAIRRRRLAAAEEATNETAPPRRKTVIAVAGSVHAIGSIIVAVASAAVLFLSGSNV